MNHYAKDFIKGFTTSVGCSLSVLMVLSLLISGAGLVEKTLVKGSHEATTL